MPEDVGQIRQQLGRAGRAVCVPEVPGGLLDAVGGLGEVQPLEQQMVEHERDVERRVAVMRDLEIEHPDPFSDQHVLRRIVAVDQASPRRTHPLDEGVDGSSELRAPPGNRPIVGIDA